MLITLVKLRIWYSLLLGSTYKILYTIKVEQEKSYPNVVKTFAAFPSSVWNVLKKAIAGLSIQ